MRFVAPSLINRRNLVKLLVCISLLLGLANKMVRSTAWGSGGSNWLLLVFWPAKGLIWQILWNRSEEHTSELQSLMRISYAVFCLKKKNKNTIVKEIRYSDEVHTKA